MINNLLRSIRSIPREVSHFLGRVVLVFVLWKAVYIFLMLPNEIPDAWLVRTLGSSSAWTMSVFYQGEAFQAKHTRKLKTYGEEQVWVTHSYIYNPAGRAVLGIYQACNGLELMVLTAGFILCFKGSWKKKLVFVAAGTLGLFALNVLRCAMLGIVNIEYPRHFDFAHKYIFNLVVYAYTFFIWIVYVAKVKPRLTTPIS
jgi:exosortase/archaeosortase family protein